MSSKRRTKKTVEMPTTEQVLLYLETLGKKLDDRYWDASTARHEVLYNEGERGEHHELINEDDIEEFAKENFNAVFTSYRRVALRLAHMVIKDEATNEHQNMEQNEVNQKLGEALDPAEKDLPSGICRPKNEMEDNCLGDDYSKKPKDWQYRFDNPRAKQNAKK